MSFLKSLGFIMSLLLITISFSVKINAENISIFDENSLQTSGIDFGVSALQNNNIIINTNIKVGEQLQIDLSSLKKEFNNLIEFEWSEKGATIKKGPVFEKVYNKPGKIILNLNIYNTKDNTKTLLNTKEITLFIYSEKSLLIFDSSLGKLSHSQYINKSYEKGIYVDTIFQSNTKEIESKNILNIIQKSSINKTSTNDYITIWGDKDFLLSILGKINKEITTQHLINKYNIVLISPFNTDVLNNYLRNFLSNKLWIKSILLIPDSSIAQLRYNPNNIIQLEDNLQSKQYEYISIDTKVKIHPILFVSKFINTLSNQGFQSHAIYLILLIPFLLTAISIFKHVIGLSPIGITIPIFLILLIFQIGLLSTAIIFTTFLISNLILGKMIAKYTLLYTPKMSFLLIINILILVSVITLLFSYNILHASMSDTLFIVLFIIIIERLISIILSKEFNEYSASLLNTILYTLVMYIFFSFPLIKTIILAYPEFILILIPINFFIGKFTGLRITEYFRFREIIQDTEE